MIKTKQTLLALALVAVSAGAAAAPSNDYELSKFPHFVSTVDRATVVAELKAADAAGLIVRGELYPVAKPSAVASPTRQQIMKEVLDAAKARDEASRTGADGYLPG